MKVLIPLRKLFRCGLDRSPNSGSTSAVIGSGKRTVFPSGGCVTGPLRHTNTALMIGAPLRIGGQNIWIEGASRCSVANVVHPPPPSETGRVRPHVPGRMIVTSAIGLLEDATEGTANDRYGARNFS